MIKHQNHIGVNMEFFEKCLFMFDKYNLKKENDFEILDGIYNLHVKVHNSIYRDKFRMIVKRSLKNNTEIPEVYLPNVKKIKGFEHIYNDGKCCLGLNYEILLAWGENRNFSEFLSNIVNPFLVNYISVEKTNEYINGDRPHAEFGVWSYYSKYFLQFPNNSIKNVLIYCHNQILRNESCKGHHFCPCASGKIIRKCEHREELKNFIEQTSSNKYLKSAFIQDVKKFLGDKNG